MTAVGGRHAGEMFIVGGRHAGEMFIVGGRHAGDLLSFDLFCCYFYNTK
jgi:hypothetical protein